MISILMSVSLNLLAAIAGWSQGFHKREAETAIPRKSRFRWIVAFTPRFRPMALLLLVAICVVSAEVARRAEIEQNRVAHELVQSRSELAQARRELSSIRDDAMKMIKDELKVRLWKSIVDMMVDLFKTGLDGQAESLEGSANLLFPLAALQAGQSESQMTINNQMNKNATDKFFEVLDGCEKTRADLVQKLLTGLDQLGVPIQGGARKAIERVIITIEGARHARNEVFGLPREIGLSLTNDFRSDASTIHLVTEVCVEAAYLSKLGRLPEMEPVLNQAVLDTLSAIDLSHPTKN